MKREFSEEKKDELYAILDAVDDHEWKSFMSWCGGRASEFGDWVDRIGISTYMRQIDTYQNKILDTNSSTRSQINIVFENVAEVDRRYAGIFQGHAETTKRQIADVNRLILYINPDARLSEIPEDTKQEHVLRTYLISRGITDSLRQQEIIDLIETERPQLLSSLYATDCYSTPDASKIMDTIEEYYTLRDNYYVGRYIYPIEYFDGIIKAYETHKIVDGRFVLDNNGHTIAYGHDVLPEEDFSDGLSLEEGLNLAIQDLDKKYDTVILCIDQINDMTGKNISIDDFTENEIMFFVDFAYNRGKGFVQRQDLIDKNEPNSSLALLIIAVSEGDDQEVRAILQAEVLNQDGEYKAGLERRRMDEYEMLKNEDYVRNDDLERWKWDVK